MVDAARADEVAWAVPWIRHDDVTWIALPRPLGAGDAAELRRTFAAQSRGDTDAAVMAVSGLEDPLLLGTVLADRYLGRRYRASAEELSDWLAQYNALPDAPAIQRLLVAMLPKGSVPPAMPVFRPLVRAGTLAAVAEDIKPPLDVLARRTALDRNVLGRAVGGDAAGALRLIAATRGISAVYARQLRAEVAQVLFTRNDDADALDIAEAALKAVASDGAAGRNEPALCFYIGGLTAWRLGQVELARDMFSAGVNAVRTTPRMHAASAFWASRASRAMHNEAEAVKFLHVAAEERLTLHGLLARRLLRLDTGVLPSGLGILPSSLGILPNGLGILPSGLGILPSGLDILPSGEILSQADVDAVAATAGGRRAFALLQIGQADRAEAELRALWPGEGDNPLFARSLLMVTAAAGLTDCAAAMAASWQPVEGRVPVPRLRPAGGFSIDPALVYAVTRIESNFNARAVSRAGARGLMQIMPATAQYISGDLFFAPRRLQEPSENLYIGQRYIAYLARQNSIDNDLMRLLASYNAGPGNFARWESTMRDHGDPLLFIETIPVAETRAFVPHALMYSWIYAARMHLPADSLDSLAAGEFPRFIPIGQDRRMTILASGPR